MTKQWPGGTHKVHTLAQKPLNEAHHEWHLAERARTYNGYLQVLWICPCGAHSRQVLTVPYLNGTKVPDPAWNGIEEQLPDTAVAAADERTDG